MPTSKLTPLVHNAHIKTQTFGSQCPHQNSNLWFTMPTLKLKPLVHIAHIKTNTFGSQCPHQNSNLWFTMPTLKLTPSANLFSLTVLQRNGILSLLTSVTLIFPHFQNCIKVSTPQTPPP